MSSRTVSMSNPKAFFTSESVTEGHPDKLCDQISDGVLDAMLRDDPLARVACEAATTTGLVLVAGEITTTTWVDIPEIVRETIRKVGYIGRALWLRLPHLRRRDGDWQAKPGHRRGRQRLAGVPRAHWPPARSPTPSWTRSARATRA